ncbi:MAG: hypothetical protein R3E65_08910 [Steroidobacteraceae bacterium]
MISLPIVRMYASAEQAQAVVAELLNRGFAEELVTLVTAASRPPANAPASAASDDPVLSSILSSYVLRAHAVVYAERIRNGNALVIVRPEFSTGILAERILDDGNPVDSGVVIDHDRLPLWDDGAPFSSLFHIPPLARGTAPLSAFFVLPVITKRGGTLCSALGLSELASHDSYIFGAPALSRSASPLSSALNLPTLLR